LIYATHPFPSAQQETTVCGIVGSFARSSREQPDLDTLRRMLGIIRHRGPDAFGIYRDERVGLGSARLSIVDLEGGNQPLHNEDGSVWIVFNGEVFNYVELRQELLARGHRLATHSDTEVIVHLYEEHGARCVEHLNGQFAFAIWDRRQGILLLARDRLGIRPLFYTEAEGSLIFGSEIKAIFADRRVSRELEPRALEQTFTCWAPLPGQTAFRGVREVPPGHTLTVTAQTLDLDRYWSLTFPEAQHANGRSVEEYAGGLRDVLTDATRIRLRADVPVGAYLSGGLDSSAITALTRQIHPGRLHTFSISFEDEAFDESAFQAQMVARLGIEHHVVRCSDADIGRVFPDVVWHAEVPLLRTSPAPMYLLSRLVRQSGFKVVLTGEGADEMLAGYDIFKEDRIRRFWARNPDSAMRPLLLRRLYPDVRNLQTGDRAFLQAFFGAELGALDRKGYSHLVRWRNTARLKRLFSEGLRASLADYDSEADLASVLDDRLLGWHPLSQAQYVEATIFLSQYLLAAQGDRVAMANSVEGRFPFLDYRVVEYCNRIPPSLKLRGLNEKFVLKEAVRDLVPPEIRRRVKRPYRAPIHRPFFGPGAPDYVSELLAPVAIARAGRFNPAAVARLVEKARRAAELSETDSMALVGVLSAQLLHHQFIEAFPTSDQIPLADVAVLEDHRLAAGQLPILV
jgi:asparagine synthase (glutamine-hydrolysing)